MAKLFRNRRIAAGLQMSACLLIFCLPFTLEASHQPGMRVEREESGVAGERSKNNAGEINQLNRIEVLSENDAVTIMLEFTAPATPKVMRLTNPRRLVLDFADTSFGPEWKQPPEITLSRGEVRSIRTALFQENPPVIRVVLDVKNGKAPEISPEGNHVAVLFATDAAALTEEFSDPSIDAGVLSGPIVQYKAGLLSVNASHATLADILHVIAMKTGASIEVPGTNAPSDLFIVKIGPSRPRDVITSLLEGGPWNYFIVEDSKGQLQKVVLTPK